MVVKKFIDFLSESYLSGGRQPLYHFTSYRISSILSDDILKTSRPSRQSHGSEKSISLTRNIDYLDTHRNCIELDQNALIKDGIRSFPVDEWAWKNGVRNKSAMSSNYNKSKFNHVKSGRRGTSHGLNLPKTPMLETEFEERIYSDIKNLGKYITSLSIKCELAVGLDKNFELRTPYLTDIKKYLDKYPHIKVYTYNTNIRKRIDITDKIIQSPTHTKILSNSGS